MYKKLIAGIIITLLLVMQLAPMGAFANDSDLRIALEELNDLKVSNPVEVSRILSGIWEYAALENGGNGSVTPDKVYEGVKSSFGILWSDLVNEVTPAVTGKIEKSSLILVINQVIVRKDIIKDMYDSFKTSYGPFVTDPDLKNVVRAVLDLENNATDAQVYAALLSTAGEVITTSGGEFVRYDNAAKTILGNLEISETIAQAILGDQYDVDINGTIDNYIEKLNQYLTDFNVDTEDAIFALEIFGLYHEPTVVPTPTPTATAAPGGGGGGGGSSEATPTPTPALIDDPDEFSDSLLGAIDDIVNETDPTKAKDLAKNLISGAAANVQALIDQGKSIVEVLDTLEKAAEAALAKVNTKTVAATVTAGKSTAVIDTADALLAMMDTIAATAAELNTELGKVSADAKIESVLNIKVNLTDTTAKTSSVQLPSSLLAAAKEKAIDKIAIDTGIATISFAPDAITGVDDSPITLSAGKVDASALTAEQKSAVGDNQVFEFTAMAGDTSITSFAKPVDITVPYTLKPGEDAEKITVFFMNASGVLENVIGTYDPITKSVKFSTSHFSMYIIKENPVTFSDLGTVEWARINIESMAAKGIITGIGEGKFAPSANLTRAQFAALLVRAYKLEDTTATNIFTDVKPTDWFYSAVVSAYKAGVVNGVSATKFDANAKVTRQDMATMVARALVSIKGKSLTADAGKYIAKFTDKAQLATYATDAANLVAKYGIIGGKPGNLFDPKGYATRAEAAAVVYRMFNVE